MMERGFGQNENEIDLVIEIVSPSNMLVLNHPLIRRLV
jgi:hypothetical protein